MNTRVKICGITNLKDARAAVEAGADFLGFVFYKKSPRYITPRASRKIIQKMGAAVKFVGVFVNEEPSQVKSVGKECGLDLFQFHGDEDAAYLNPFAKQRVIKSVRVGGASSLKKSIERACPKAGYLLFDTFQKKVFGGTGKVFDWSLLDRLEKIKTPFFVSGGLTPENVGLLLARVRPYAVDVSSGVELRPGKKSALLVKKFIEIVKSEIRISPRTLIKNEAGSSKAGKSETISKYEKKNA